MGITVLRKRLRVNKYLYYGIVLFVFGIQGVYAAQGEKPAQPKARNANAQSEAQPSPVISPSSSQAAVDQPKSDKESQESSKEPTAPFWNATLADWIQVGINAVLLLVVFWQAKINHDQWVTMEKQNTIMQGELDTTKTTLEQSGRALVAAESQAKTAEQSVQIAKETFYIGERPYFGITQFNLEILRLVTGYYAPRLVIHFQNGGKTPAWKFYAHVALVFGDTPDAETRWGLNATEPDYALRYFGTGASNIFVFQKAGVELTEDQMRALRDKSTDLFVVVNIEYDDLRGEALSQQFIGSWNVRSSKVSDWEA